jgi:hypothetical protein
MDIRQKNGPTPLIGFGPKRKKLTRLSRDALH